VIGGHGGRLDHHLANAALLGTQTGIDVEWRTGNATLHRVNRELQLTVEIGTVISLLPIGGPAGGISTTGLRWELARDTLQPGATRGVSNISVAADVTIRVETGNLVAIVLTGSA
jgi:thiamine pyrophosphokinase